ncbi:Malate-2H+/Na+-lactate antiporter [Hondaea fermentalgiana]|uniref:Malate-2H+/Na+-lactate antiporter n=1 Tax=Hondaea fermentalgiana TaxID=2315210 RepID=A0A2R5GE30_9STRA|nr:Malate-2H+/Na+-lactate antiporter [Hondaea fermentalgiana]|eukprot:GBG26054.1 Malate-2H+/Na+-lactate antiporter [Hondaea fermentalgiana]
MAAAAMAAVAQADTIMYAPSIDEVSMGYDTLFKDEEFDVTAAISWGDLDAAYAQGDYLYWRLSVNGAAFSSGSELINASRVLLSEITATGVTSELGTTTATMEVSLDASFADEDVTSSGEASAQAINAGASVVPLIIVLLVAIFLRDVQASLFSGIFIGACMTAGDLRTGFIDTFATYLVNAVADADHQFVILFSLFLSGVVSMMQRSGGTRGLTSLMIRYAKTSRTVQVLAFCSGLLLFFDDYTNSLVIGNTMRPILDNFVSREKTAWITDATSAPIASISPISSWVGYEVSLIQTEIDRIVETNGGTAPTGLPTSGYAVFLSTIAYRYYPIYLIVFQLSLAIMQRDFGPMLIAERKIYISGRKDGGEGAFEGGGHLQQVKVRSSTPARAWNMLVPVAILVILVFYILVETGRSSTGADADFLDVIQASDSYTALLIGTVGTAVCIAVFYALQFTKDGEMTLPTAQSFKDMLPNLSCFGDKEEPKPKMDKVGSVASYNDDGEEEDIVDPSAGPRMLMSPMDSFTTFVNGLVHLFPAIIVLVLAWTVGSIMTTVGADRLFARAITGGSLNVGYLPTLTFTISCIMAIALGSSWSVMTIVFPLVTQPAWEASNGDLNIFYGTMGAVLAGSVMGDHCSPISDTTVLSSMAAACRLDAHVRTQAPYALLVALISLFCGCMPVGTGGYSTGVGMGIGSIVTIVLAFLLTAPVRCASGRLDPMTELYLLITKDEGLAEIKTETARTYAEKTSAVSLDI